METNSTLGNNIRAFRDKLALSQAELASYLSITREEVNYYENGKRNIPSDIISKSAKLFGIDEYDLYEDDALSIQANVAFAFRAESLSTSDLGHIADFRKIVQNYLKMKKHLNNEG